MSHLKFLYHFSLLFKIPIVCPLSYMLSVATGLFEILIWFLLRLNSSLSNSCVTHLLTECVTISIFEVLNIEYYSSSNFIMCKLWYVNFFEHSALFLTGTYQCLFSLPEVEVVTRKNMGVTRNEVKNQVMIPGVITHHENMIIIRLVDVLTKTVEVACL